MKFTDPILLLLLLGATLSSAADTTSDISVPTSTDASSFLSAIYAPSAIPSGVTGAVATSLASALYSLEYSFATRTAYRSDVNAIWSAAAQATDASAIEASLSNGWDWSQITTNAWYQSGVPESVKTDVLSYNSAWDSVNEKVLGTASSTSSKAGVAGPVCTGMAGVVVAAAAGAMGVVVAL